MLAWYFMFSICFLNASLSMLASTLGSMVTAAPPRCRLCLPRFEPPVRLKRLRQKFVVLHYYYIYTIHALYTYVYACILGTLLYVYMAFFPLSIVCITLPPTRTRAILLNNIPTWIHIAISYTYVSLWSLRGFYNAFAPREHSGCCTWLDTRGKSISSTAFASNHSYIYSILWHFIHLFESIKRRYIGIIRAFFANFLIYFFYIFHLFRFFFSKFCGIYVVFCIFHCKVYLGCAVVACTFVQMRATSARHECIIIFFVGFILF